MSGIYTAEIGTWHKPVLFREENKSLEQIKEWLDFYWHLYDTSRTRMRCRVYLNGERFISRRLISETRDMLRNMD